VRGAGCREINLRIRRREKNVLDILFYRSGVYTNYDPRSLPTEAPRWVVSVIAISRQLFLSVRLN
jgi:hypothetical protein